MKKACLWSILLIITLGFCLSCTKKSKEGLSPQAKHRWSTAKDGLRIRKAPSLKSVKIGLIPFDTMVELLDESGTEQIISGTRGKWSKVKWNEITGWVFGGYLREKKNEPTNKTDKNTISAGESKAEAAQALAEDLALTIADGRETRETLAKIQGLLKKGADPNLAFYSKSKECFSPMHLAVMQLKLAALKLLIQYGGNVNLKLAGPLSVGPDEYFKSGITPMDIAEKYNGLRKKEARLLFNYLKKKGAQPSGIREIISGSK